MLKRLIKDESGMAMGLAIMTMVLVGVMGAGLLVFVQRDLETVVEVNQGQKALEIADAGVQVAQMQQLSDVVRQHYDRDYTNDCAPGKRLTQDDWSPNTTVYPNPDCTGTPITKTQGGVTRDFAGGRFNVTIECFDQLNDPAGDPCARITGLAPESIEALKRTFFKVTSTGYFPADGSGAKRKVEAIYHTNRLDVPTAYYTPNDIDFNGNVTVRGVSFFAGGNIYRNNNSNLIRTEPALYRDWDTTNADNFTPTSNLNTVPRTNAAGARQEGAGLGAEGLICQQRSQCSGPSNSIADGEYDYDSSTGTKGSRKQFIRKSDTDIANNVANAPGKISYPFNPNAEFDLETLERIAREQQNYYEGEIDIVDTNSTTTNKKYPVCSTNQTVFYVKASGAKIDYSVNYDNELKSECKIAKGLIVVQDGNFEISNSSNGFDGVVIVTGNGTTTGTYKNLGRDTVKGFVVADGKMDIGGGVDPLSVVGEYAQRPGFYNMRLWSWRELYQ